MNEKRQQILDTATQLFARHGFHAVGVDWIIAKSLVSKMTMYRYFPSKAELVLDVLRTQQAAWTRTLQAHVECGATPAARLRRVFQWYGEWFRRPDFSGSLFAHAMSEFADKGTQIHRIIECQRSDMLRILEANVAELDGVDNAAASAGVLLMLLDGATLAAQATGDDGGAADAWRAACKYLDLPAEHDVAAAA